ncbi:MAG: hypothetical protein M3253_07745 [Chloroflexota bacterium]|nr:hypothetical protein [Chloroflexota bacterium]
MIDEHSRHDSTLRTGAWILLSSLAALLAFLPAAVAGTWLSDTTGGGNPLRLGLTHAMWALLATGLVLGLASVLLPYARVRHALRLVFLVVAGASAAGLAAAGLVIWTEARFGRFDPEYTGWSFLVPVVLIVLTAGLAASLATTGGARRFAVIGTSAALGALAVLAFQSTPGLLDGLSQDGSAVGMALAAAAAYALVAVGVLLAIPLDEREAAE